MKPIFVRGGVYITIGTGTTSLLDILNDEARGTLVDQTYNAQATLYINLHPSVSNFELCAVRCGYVDTANADDLANIIFYSGTSATPYLQETKQIYATGAIAETPLTGAIDLDPLTTPRICMLDTPGRLYFKTDWTNAVINCGAATEWFWLEVFGKKASQDKTWQ